MLCGKRVRSHLHLLVPALLVTLMPAIASADRFHVRSGGELTAGPSVQNDWTPANCYGDLATALAACAPADSVLLYAEPHALGVEADLPALVTNQDLSDQLGAAEIVLSAAGALRTGGAAPDCELRGLAVSGGEPGRTTAALTVVATGGATTVALRGAAFRTLERVSAPGAGGAAVSATGTATGVVLTLDRCEFVGNESPNRGGAVYVGSGFVVDATECLFIDNAVRADGRGGAIGVFALASRTSMTLDRCTFTGNTAAGAGGAIDAVGCVTTMRGCVVSNSRSAVQDDAFFAEGAGVRFVHESGHTDPVTILLEDCTFTENRGNLANSTASGDGGAVYVRGGEDRLVDMQVTGCTFTGNVNAQGAGIYYGRYATGTVEYCRFHDNIAWYQGGGVMKGGTDANLGELVTFVYCEFLGNRAGYDADGVETDEYSRGGAVMVRYGPRVDLFNCTFIDNAVNGFDYAIGDAFAHPIENGDDWEPENLCSLANCVFWGEGNDVQAHAEGIGGMAQVSNVAAEADQLVLGVTPAAVIVLTADPFDPESRPYPAEGSPLVDGGLELGYTRDIAGRLVPIGDAPDVGAYEFFTTVAVEDVVLPPTTSLTVFPNPFNPRTTIAARLDAPASVVLAVYDSRGHRVAELLRAALPAGTHEVRWDGRDDRGRAVAAGTYLARLVADGQPPVVTKLNLVR